MSTTHQHLREKLLEAGFEGTADDSLETRDAYATDESIFYLRPELVLTPQHTADITLAVQYATSHTHPANPIHLTPRAAGTGLSGGSLNDSIILDIHKTFSTIHSEEKNSEGILYECDPGVMYRDLEQVMNKAGVYIPSRPASKNICTIGGMVANNAAGADSYRYGHTAQYVRALNIILSDGKEYHIRPLEWKEFQKELQRDDHLGVIYRYIWDLCLHHEELLINARPHSRKNSAGYALWDVVSTTVEEFMDGRGVFDLTQVLTGSQGTLGIITRIWIQAIMQEQETSLISLPLYDISQAGEIINHIAEYHPINVELFDGDTYQSARAHKDFFRDQFSATEYSSFLKALRKHYNLTLGMRVPKYFILITLDENTSPRAPKLITELRKQYRARARFVTNKTEAEMLWKIRQSSYTLSKLANPNKRPAAFLEDIAVPTEKLQDFLSAIRELFEKYDIQAYVHGHGGNGHLHFYPLMDFTQANTAQNIRAMAQEFFTLATSLGGSICGEHNDGIIRTPYLETMFSQEILAMFAQLERVCDPQDIFNPGKKVRPRFKLSDVIRHTN